MNDLLEIKLFDPDGFLKIKETLTRIGIASKKEKILYQSCHILHKKGKYYITHFKELFNLDGKCDFVPQEDIARRNTIASLLEEWELLYVVNPPDDIDENYVPINTIKILSHKEKDLWKLISKYSVGKYSSK